MLLANNAAEVNRLLAGVSRTMEKVRYCWLLTAAGEAAMRCRPMGRVPRDADEDDWTLRFLTDGHSRKVADLRRGGTVTALFQDDPADAYVALAGKARLSEDEEENRRRWMPAYNVYFPTEKDRANALFFTITVTRLELWIRGVTPEPFGLRTTMIERHATHGWRLATG
jgi:general stress protein 26